MARDIDPDDLPKAPINRQTLREAAQLLGYVRPYWLKLSAALVCLAVGSLLGLAFPYLAGNLVDAALLRLQDRTVKDWRQDVNLVAIGLVVVLAFQAIFAFLRALWFIEVGERSLADLRRDTYARLVRLPMSFHTARRVGELASRISADLATIRDTLIDGIPHLLREAVLLVGGLTLIAITSLRLTGVMLVSFPVLMIIAVLFGKVIRRIAKEVQDRLADSNVIVEETLQNIASVKAFANEPFEEGRYRAALAVYLEAAIRGAFFEGAFISFIIFALFGSIVLVLWYGASMVFAGQLEVGELTRFMLLTVYVGGAVGSFAQLYSQLQRMLGASQRVRELLRETQEFDEPRNTGVSPVMEARGESPVLRVPRLRGEVRFEDVRFRYPSRPEVPVLRDVSLTARAGQRVALVGPSGAGKSTIVSMLLRFYAPESGRILIDDRDAQEYDLHALRSQMAVVPQDVILFGGTIAENIAYGKPGASQKEIEDAARKANAHEFIVVFPDGYQTKVGERGVQLSGGQRQRVAIARAILRDPAILLLDEATSSLDSENERLVLQALDRLMEGRTAIVIAHRLSTIRGADRIFVIKDGSVVESGSHAELMGQHDGVYRNLSSLQLDSAGTTPELVEDYNWPTTTLPIPLPPRS
jgi:ATP-binding cassette subfamily B protein